jgi:hypothetical protein
MPFPSPHPGFVALLPNKVKPYETLTGECPEHLDGYLQAIAL